MSDAENKLAPCPCGETPANLVIEDGSTYRWRIISGDCCGEWMIESSRIEYKATDEQVKQQCIKDWNNANRRKCSGVSNVVESTDIKTGMSAKKLSKSETNYKALQCTHCEDGTGIFVITESGDVECAWCGHIKGNVLGANKTAS